MDTKVIWGIVIAVVLLGGAWLITKDGGEDGDMMEDTNSMVGEVVEKDDAMMDDDAMESDDAMMEKESAMMEGAGTYEAYEASKIAKAKDGKVVLFFRASWCPSCKALNADIKESLKDIPAGVTVLDTDYDQYTELKKKYGVTTQHTLVQVDADGNEITKWVGSNSLEELVANLK